MLRICHFQVLFCAGLVLLATPGCASDHFFPKLRPLFAGLDESKVVMAAAKFALAEAKTDFRLAQHGKAPLYSRCVSGVPGTHSKIYQGNGYQLTVVNNDLVRPQAHGPEIVLDTFITGGKPFRFSDIDRSWD